MGPTPTGTPPPTAIGHPVSTFRGWAPLQVHAPHLVCKPQSASQALLGHREAEQLSRGHPTRTWHNTGSRPSSRALEL